MKRPKILYLVTEGNRAGPQIHILLCCKRLKEEFDLVVCSGTDDFLGGELAAIGVPFHKVDSLGRNRPTLSDPLIVKDLKKLFQELKPDLISCHSTKAGFVGRIAARMAGIPAIFTAHGWSFTDGAPPLRKKIAPHVERWLARRAARIICVSENDRRSALAARIAPPDKLITVHNGMPDVDPKFFANPGRGEKTIITMIARFQPQKDQPLLLDALAGLRASTPPWEMWFVGYGALEEAARRQADALGLSDRVKFLGEQGDEIPALLARSHAFALITKWEGFPRSILEAMRAGLPVLASDVGGVRESVADGETGFLAPRGDEQAVKEKLKKIISDPSLREKMGKAGRKRFVEEFTLEAMLAKTRAVYLDVLEKHSNAAAPV